MKRLTSLFAVTLFLPLTACSLVEVQEDDTVMQDDTHITDDVPVRETANVMYEGEVQPAGISIYQQGSHRLVLPGGKFILLESDTLDLNGYVGEKVSIYGALRPTIEAGGMIMRVDRIELKSPEPVMEEEASSDSSVSSDDNITSDSSTSSEPSDSSDNSVSSDMSEAMEESSSSEEATEEVIEPSAAMLEQIDVLSRQDYAKDNWTQQYCTSHIGFCIPVHRNWWFKSFGATNTTLWHVEFSGAPIDALHQGPIVLDLIAGSNAPADGTVDTTGGKSIGYKEWTFGRHFRISADDSLEAAVRYLTEHITEYVQ